MEDQNIYFCLIDEEGKTIGIVQTDNENKDFEHNICKAIREHHVFDNYLNPAEALNFENFKNKKRTIIIDLLNDDEEQTTAYDVVIEHCIIYGID